MPGVLTVLEVLAVLAVLFVAAVVATREGPILGDVHRDRPDLGLPTGPLQPEDVSELRFGLAVRGYRMREVDEVLDRVAVELASCDAQVAELLRERLAGAPVEVAAPSYDGKVDRPTT